jgi:hypothetical protein
LLKNHGERKIQDVTVEMAINGARAIKSMVTETSDLDANMGPVAAVGLAVWVGETKGTGGRNGGKMVEKCGK